MYFERSSSYLPTNITSTKTRLCCRILFSVSDECFQVPNGFMFLILKGAFQRLVLICLYLRQMTWVTSMFIFIFYFLFTSNAEVVCIHNCFVAQVYPHIYLCMCASNRTWLCGCNNVYICAHTFVISLPQTGNLEVCLKLLGHQLAS